MDHSLITIDEPRDRSLISRPPYSTRRARTSTPTIDVTQYTDYRAFLSDYLALKRNCVPKMSVRQFCRKAGLTTDNYLLRVLRCERNLGPQVGEKFVRVIGLKGMQADYFIKLVKLGLAKSTKEKEDLLVELEFLRRKRKSPNPVIDNSVIRYWYVGAIWELASCNGFVLTPQSAVTALKRRISIQEAKEALEFLIQRGYLVEEEGRLKQHGTPLLSTDGKTDLIVRLSHKDHLKAAIESVDLPIEERGFFGLTLAFSEKQLPLVKDRLRKVLNELHQELSFDPDARTVYRIQAHCFPLAKTD